jgi:hypothetical protein
MIIVSIIISSATAIITIAFNVLVILHVPLPSPLLVLVL